MFQRTGDDRWIVQESLRVGGAGLTEDDQFGASVAISGAYAVVGAPSFDNDTGEAVGAAYVFRRTGTSWSAGEPLTPDATSVEEDLFGRSVAISGAYAVVGKLQGIGLFGLPGRAYLFHRTDTDEWVHTSFEPAAADPLRREFGDAVAIDESTVVVGDYAYDSLQGAVYAWRYR